ncbi:4-hydroxybenzoate geranyltransferase 1 [Colletotrichum chlorophyti]|uniref:Diterpenoid pyrone biosynthesis cluster protein C n=1 Tax=Colletotrichum chlorophyti TaxID=708187 RepID=A0A1Q8S2D3_9PEZI|nr:4-hydroxybenzoate geranyltransferase 1 [Colletotrichum chlorophyti]
MLYQSISHAIALYRLEQSAKQCKNIYTEKPQPEKVTLLWHLVTLSRFNKYNPLFTTFAGVWSALLAGATELADPNNTLQPAFVFRQATLCFLAAYLFCGAGMVWNDWVDRDIDAKVARTKDRPLAAGTVTTVDAMLWMVLQLLMSSAVVHNMLDGKDVWRHMIPLVVASLLYPYGKRPMALKLRIYPQYILGFTIAWPAIMGRAAIQGRYESFGDSVGYCFPLCCMIFFWIIYLNTAYSYQDVVDDRKINVNSFYTVAGRNFHRFLVVLVSPILMCMPLYLLRFRSLWLWASWMGVWTASFVVQLSQFDPQRPASGGSVHKSNFLLGVWTIIACAVEVSLNDHTMAIV